MIFLGAIIKLTPFTPLSSKNIIVNTLVAFNIHLLKHLSFYALTLIHTVSLIENQLI